MRRTLTDSQIDIAVILAGHGNMTARQLAAVMETDSARLGKALAGLRTRGLISKADRVWDPMSRGFVTEWTLEAIDDATWKSIATNFGQRYDVDMEEAA